MNRQLVTKLATYHFAATPGNRDTLLAEGVDSRKIFVTGNPVVDSLNEVLRKGTSSPFVRGLLKRTNVLSFFPGMTLEAEKKLEIIDQILGRLEENYRITNL